MRTAGIALVLMAAAGTAGAEERDRLEVLSEAAARSHAGDHLAAIKLYEQANRGELDLDLLVTIGTEYRAAGKPDEALVNLCTYLALEPSGARAAFATAQVYELQAARGRRVDSANVCAPAEPMIPSVGPSPQRMLPELNPPAERMLPGLGNPAERMLPPISNSGLSQREITGLGLGALGVVSAGVGVYFGLRASAISDDIAAHDASQPWPANINELEARGQRAETLQGAFMLGGALAIGAGAILYVTGRSERMSITPTASQTGGGFTVSGGF